MGFFSTLTALLLLTTMANSYSLDGAWDLVPSAGQYQYIDSNVTFQFKRQVDSQGAITSQLFVYNCFLSQYLYEVDQDEISFYFKTSSLLSQNCSLSQINQLKTKLQSIYYFTIDGDSLILQSLTGKSVFSLQREKIDYRTIMVGVWQFFTSTQAASTLTEINGTMMAMCGGANGFYYNMMLVNGSYPSLSVKGSIAPNCADRLFSNLIYSVAFFTVAANRTQLSLYDISFRLLFKMNKVSNLDFNSLLDVNVRQSAPVQTKDNSNSLSGSFAGQSAVSTTTTQNQATNSNANVFNLQQNQSFDSFAFTSTSSNTNTAFNSNSNTNTNTASNSNSNINTATNSNSNINTATNSNSNINTATNSNTNTAASSNSNNKPAAQPSSSLVTSQTISNSTQIVTNQTVPKNSTVITQTNPNQNSSQTSNSSSQASSSQITSQSTNNNSKTNPTQNTVSSVYQNTASSVNQNTVSSVNTSSPINSNIIILQNGSSLGLNSSSISLASQSSSINTVQSSQQTKSLDTSFFSFGQNNDFFGGSFSFTPQTAAPAQIITSTSSSNSSPIPSSTSSTIINQTTTVPVTSTSTLSTTSTSSSSLTSSSTSASSSTSVSGSATSNPIQKSQSTVSSNSASPIQSQASVTTQTSNNLASTSSTSSNSNLQNSNLQSQGLITKITFTQTQTQTQTQAQKVQTSSTQNQQSSVPTSKQIIDLVTSGVLNNQINVAVPLSEFLQTGKWLITWISGITYVPSNLQLVYLIFTSAKIILYCPCNTYYTNYALNGNTLTNIQWTGTQNQCQNSQDNLVTGVIFYSKLVKANGNNLAFYYNNQIKMAEFKPFF